METAVVRLPMLVQDAGGELTAAAIVAATSDGPDAAREELSAAIPETRVPVLTLDLRRRIEAAEPKPPAAYCALRQLAALADLPRTQRDIGVVGIASTYNPHRDGAAEGGAATASGEFYDAQAWTAAIQIDLRGQFGGVRYGRNYRPAYVLVEAGDKQAIVKINDVGPLKPGRVIDLNERSMRYFDPFMRRGLLHETRVTLLPGEDWTPGPVGSLAVVRTAGNL